MAEPEPLEAPEVHAVVVEGSKAGTEAVDVLIAWTDLEAIEAIATSVLDQLRDELGPAPTFAGEVTFYLPPAYTPDDAPAIARIGLRLKMATMLWRTAEGAPWAIQVVRGLAPKG
jgi:hypothetical protein